MKSMYSKVPNVDLNLIRVFLAVYRAGGISAAASQLNLTQPAVSNALTRLNSALNCQFFVRAGRGIRASEEAHNLYKKVNGSYDKLQGAFLEFSDFNPLESDRHFRTSLSDYFDSMMPLLGHYIETNGPNITFERVQYNLKSNFSAIREGTIDLMLLAFEHEDTDFCYHPLITDELILISRIGHPILEKRKSLSVSLMRQLRFASLIEIHEHAMPAYHVLKDHQIKVYLRTVSFTDLLYITMNTDYVALVPKNLVESWSFFQVQQYPLPFRATIPLSLIWAKKNENENGHKWLRNMVIRAFSPVLSSD
jgi:DNA-binding transcriptional LysR family regulator